MKLYKDASRTEEILTLDLGIVMAGETQQFTYHLYNDTAAFVDNMEITVPHKEVKVVKAPKTLSAFTSADVVIEWAPAVSVKEGLKTNLKITAQQIWS